MRGGNVRVCVCAHGKSTSLSVRVTYERDMNCCLANGQQLLNAVPLPLSIVTDPNRHARTHRHRSCSSYQKKVRRINVPCQRLLQESAFVCIVS